MRFFRFETTNLFQAMHHTEQTEAFQQALEALIERHCDEFDLTFGQIVGVLQMQVVFLSLESREQGKGDSDHG